MTNEKAIDLLDNLIGMVEDNHNSDYDKALKMAIKSLEQTGWIPVRERLPEEDGCYLVTTTGTNNDIIDIAYYTDGIWHKASRIKAWMPLPESYKPQESEDE